MPGNISQNQKTFANLDAFFEKRFPTQTGLASEYELMRFFTILSTLKLVKGITIWSAYEQLIKKLSVIK